MIRIAIFTTGKAGRRILDLLKCLENVEVAYFVDNNANQYTGRIESIRIVSLSKIKKEIDEGRVDFIVVPSDRMISYGLREYTLQLDNTGIRQYKIIPSQITRKEQIENDDVRAMKELHSLSEL